LKQLYPSRKAYERAVADDVAELVSRRFVTRQDGDELVREAKRVAIP